ncbi:uncharacterized protein LOC129909411 [Episyrphus balteatus]|uniref:uncharacterized protein LOC129909411 n=1 Tax=Episyrphus balteatus TaxID=286459 RepID=UPI002486638C|nr:uncharacterized protein LOC129909411 [Episyrphus balteatus]
MHQHLAWVLSEQDFIVCDRITSLQVTKTQQLCTEKQQQKFDKLSNAQTTQPAVNTIDLTKAVVNLSNTTLSAAATSILSKGLNFAPTPRRVPIESLIGSVEECIARNKFNSIDTETIRQDIAVMVRRTKIPSASNVSRDEMLALNELRREENILILSADKGNATVVLNRCDYLSKMNVLVEDVNIYLPVNYDPTARVLRKVTKLINENKAILPPKRLIPSCTQPPKLYGLPKIHKNGNPMRPIVSQINSPCYLISKHLVDVFKPLVGGSEHHIKDSAHFVSILSGLRLENDEMMVSFDVESLFTNVPVQEVLVIIRELISTAGINENYLPLLDFCLSSGYFCFNGQFYLQKDGVAMGLPLAPLIADIWMENFEKKALDSSKEKPRVWLRYVDDTFCILKNSAILHFLEHLNALHPKIKFTMEKEKEGSIAFLDVKVMRNQNGSLGHTVYRKSTHTNRYLHADSHHHPANLSSVVSTLFQRAHRICDSDHLSTELLLLDKVLEANGYSKKQRSWKPFSSQEMKENQLDKKAFLPYVKGVTDRVGKILKRYGVKSIFLPPKKVINYLKSPKDQFPLETPGVYAVPCSCGASYVGQTQRSIATRLKEHISAVSKKQREKSAICEHILDHPDEHHWIHFDQAKVLAKEAHYIPRLVREAIEIKRHQNFNRDDSFKLSRTWDPLINSSRSIQLPLHTNSDIVSTVCSQLQQNTEPPTPRYNLRSQNRI